MNKRIVVHDLNKLRWAYPNQTFTTNVLRPTSMAEFNDLKSMLRDRGIAFSTQTRYGASWAYDTPREMCDD